MVALKILKYNNVSLYPKIDKHSWPLKEKSQNVIYRYVLELVPTALHFMSTCALGNKHT